MPTQPASNPKASVRETSREGRLLAILAAAREVFESEGYEQATVSEIARRVGVVEGTVFHYVGNKRGLVLMVIEQFYEQLIVSQAEGLASVDGIRNRLLFLIRFHLTMLSDHSALCGVILNEGRTVDQSLTKDIRRLNRRYTSSLVVELENGVKSGEIRGDISPPLVRNIIYGTMEQALWAHLADGQPIAVDETIRHLSIVVFTGIGPSDLNDSAGVVEGDSGPALKTSEITALVNRLNHLLEQQA